MNRSLAIGLSIPLLSFIVLNACVGDDAVSGGPGGGSNIDPNSDGGPSGNNDGGPSSCAGNTIEACGATCQKCEAPTGGTVECVNGACQPKCTGTQVLCGGACVETTTNAAHCGKCDHSCGAGQCNGSSCQPITVASGFTEVHGIATSSKGAVIAADDTVSLCANAAGCTNAQLATIKTGISQLDDVTVAGANVFLSGNDGDAEIVWWCPLDGCPAAGPNVAENVMNYSVGRVIAGPNDVVWTRYDTNYGPYSRKCSATNCTTVVDVRHVGAVNPYYTWAGREMDTPSHVVSVGALSTLWSTGGIYNSSDYQLRACPLTTDCASPIEIPTGQNYVSALTYYNGKHYGASGASVGTNVIFSVNDASPGARELLVSDAYGIIDIAVDASGIYWVNQETKKILRCSNLAGCNGSGELLAADSNISKPIDQYDQFRTRIRLDDKFVYWTTRTTVMKVAK